MDETDVFAQEAADVAVQAIKEGVARINLTWDEVYQRAKADIAAARALVEDMKKLGHIKEPPAEMLEEALKKAIAAIK
jgi:malate dehydrogenase (oxaloacetate-decarboxylating)